MIRAEKLGFKYKCGRVVLSGIDFSLNRGEVAAVLGNNGAGKSTLLKCLIGILPCKTGTVYIDNLDISKMTILEISRNVAFVSQKEDAPRIGVYESVLLGRKPHMKFAPSRHDKEIADKVIERMGLGKIRDRNVCDLSGGEFQKIMIARAICQQPKILLLDEPTSNLDLKNQHDTLSLVSEIAKENGISVLMAIHDINLAVRYCDKFLTLKNGHLYSFGGIETLTGECLNEVYGIPVKLYTLNGQIVAIADNAPIPLKKKTTINKENIF